MPPDIQRLNTRASYIGHRRVGAHFIPLFVTEARAADFWARVSKGDPEGCWLWTGQTDQRGYGLVTVSGKRFRAHRLAWELANGSSPGDMFVCHACDNPPCVNPAHLWLGTCRDNNHDMIAKGRHRAGRAETQARLTEEIVRQIKSSPERTTIIAERFGLRHSTVSAIRRGQNWAWVKVENEVSPPPRAGWTVAGMQASREATPVPREQEGSRIAPRRDPSSPPGMP
jgi:hypothetical protein